jgi:hypothetical protein
VSRALSFAVLVIAVFSIILAYFMYGSGTFIFLTTLPGTFFLIFGVGYIGCSMQASSIPGIENLDEPDLFWSRIYMAWLFVNDREGWALYETLISGFFGFISGSLFGLVPSALFGIDPTVSLAGWALGIFIMFLAAIVIATSEKWKEKAGVSSQNRNLETP